MIRYKLTLFISFVLLLLCIVFFANRGKNSTSHIYVKLVNDVRENNITAVTKDLSDGVNPNKFPHEDELDEAALCVAAYDGNLPIVNLLLDYHADPNIHDGWQGTPISAAASSNNVDVLQALASRGAKINDDGDGNSRALWVAAVNGKISAMRFLLSHGANPNSVENSHTSDAASVLTAAESCKQVSAVILLKKYGAKELRVPAQRH
ncbi:hypothetical protein CCAX7_62320 [Capsulimonas corticalis]|uniref:Ankyrin repeat-containing protein n=1 Tax=Capsulimonas corticalis TaxID=2219043 RepID=A0A9N7QH13_9BACT|nr:ankyrin repeat domain-containing protein [Capsulimonas corticalis]BDI34181.1 hypothetical protein CCAX7_62320 [Capsulimonas corticalis]